MTESPMAGVRSRSVGSKRLSPGSITGNVVMFVGLAYFLIPLVWLFLASTKSNSGLFSSFGFWFDKDFNLIQNLQDLLARDNGAFVIWMRNTAIYAFIASVGSTLIAALAGYAFAVYRFRGRNILFAIILASVFVPATILAVPLYFMLGTTGLSNSLLAVILPGLVNPFGVYLMRIYAERAVPEELLDAARVDGAGELRIFASIVLPVIRPGLAALGVLTFINIYNDFVWPVVAVNDEQHQTLQVMLSALAQNIRSGQLGADWTSVWGQLLAASTVAAIPVLIVFIVLQRHLIKGVMAGSLKG
jgi:multiple sugar transport system permease protein